MPILVIDDSLTIRKLLEMSLVRAGHKVVLAGTAAEGLALARSVQPRLILLDYVLPDRRGAEVCADFARDPATASIPVVVMSAKGDADVRQAFRGQTQVAEFLAKPFAPAAITELVARMLRRPGTGTIVRPSSESVRRPTSEVVIRPASLTRPIVIEAAPEEVPAQEMLTPAGALEPRTAAVAPIEAEPSLFSGSTALVPIPALVRLLATLGRTGELVLGTGPTALSLFCERGELVLVTVSAELAPEAAAAAGVAVARAGIASGDDVPLVVRLVEAASGEAATAVLHRMGLAALVAASAGDPRSFRWHDVAPLPAPVARHARTITADQLALERLRQVDDWSQVELEIASLEQICSRSPGMRERLPALDLNDTEQRVLALVNGRRSVRAIVDGCRLSTFEVFHALFRLIQARLVEPRPSAGVAAQPVLWCGSADMIPSLTRILAERSLPPPVTATVDDLSIALARTGARVVVVDAAEVDAVAIARGVRSRLESSDATLVALVEAPDGEGLLASAGYDAVLVTPVHANDLHHLLV